MNRQIHPQNDTEISPEEIVAQMNQHPQFRQSFALLGRWYERQPPSADRIREAVKLGETLIFDHDNFLNELIGAYQTDDLDYEKAVELVRDGYIQGDTPYIEVAAMLGAITCAR